MNSVENQCFIHVVLFIQLIVRFILLQTIIRLLNFSFKFLNINYSQIHLSIITDSKESVALKGAHLSSALNYGANAELTETMETMEG